MTRPISKETLDEIRGNSFYERCCISGRVPVQFHHNLIFGGRQVDEPWAILPLHQNIHALANRLDIKEKLDFIMLNRATDKQLKAYSKVEDLIEKRKNLNIIYGKRD